MFNSVWQSTQNSTLYHQARLFICLLYFILFISYVFILLYLYVLCIYYSFFVYLIYLLTYLFYLLLQLCMYSFFLPDIEIPWMVTLWLSKPFCDACSPVSWRGCAWPQPPFIGRVSFGLSHARVALFGFTSALLHRYL